MDPDYSKRRTERNVKLRQEEIDEKHKRRTVNVQSFLTTWQQIQNGIYTISRALSAWLLYVAQKKGRNYNRKGRILWK